MKLELVKRNPQFAEEQFRLKVFLRCVFYKSYTTAETLQQLEFRLLQDLDVIKNNLDPVEENTDNAYTQLILVQQQKIAEYKNKVQQLLTELENLQTQILRQNEDEAPQPRSLNQSMARSGLASVKSNLRAQHRSVDRRLQKEKKDKGRQLSVTFNDQQPEQLYMELNLKSAQNYYHREQSAKQNSLDISKI